MLQVIRRPIDWCRDNPMVLLALCVGFLAGLLFLMPLIPYRLPDSTANIVGAAVGAAIAVLGAVLASDYRDRAQRRQLISILIVGIKELYAEASAFDDKLHSSGGIDITTGVLPVLSRWHHIAAFSPYRELGDFRLVNAMAEIDVICRQLIPLSEPGPEIQNSPGLFGGAAWLRGNKISRAGALVQNLMNACREASIELRK